MDPECILRRRVKIHNPASIASHWKRPEGSKVEVRFLHRTSRCTIAVFDKQIYSVEIAFFRIGEVAEVLTSHLKYDHLDAYCRSRECIASLDQSKVSMFDSVVQVVVMPINRVVARKTGHRNSPGTSNKRPL
jgi:hypothetical protein